MKLPKKPKPEPILIAPVPTPEQVHNREIYRRVIKIHAARIWSRGH